MIVESNKSPFESPGAPHAGSSIDTSNVHNWRGHEVLVRCKAAALTLWIDYVFVVAIDGRDIQRQWPFRIIESFNFKFNHEDRLIQGTVTRKEEVFRRGILYTLTIDGEYVAEGQTSIQNWHLGLCIILLSLVAILFAVFVFKLL